MSVPTPPTRNGAPTISGALFLAGSLLLGACVDAPYAPTDVGVPGVFVLAPNFSLVGPDGPARTEAQNDALNQAFDQVNRFRMKIRRQADDALLLDTVLVVKPGQDEYDLSVDVPGAVANQAFLVTIIAMKGQQELFTAENIPVKARPAGAAAAGGQNPAPVNVPLTYSGPGADAVSVELAPETVVAAANNTLTFGAGVLDGDGAVIAGSPVVWSSTNPSVVSVNDSGEAATRGDGVAQVVVTTPTGLEARAWVYVVTGNLAYVEGGALRTRLAAGGQVLPQGGTAASAPAWRRDGNVLLYADNGHVFQAPNGKRLTEGSWPSLSSDGAMLAVERDGRVWLANNDGTHPTEGPPGTTPVWVGGTRMVVGGGSIEEMEADGSGRTTLISGDARYPAVRTDGMVAYVAGDALMVQGRAAPLATGVRGRPSWSADGIWLAVASDSGILLVAADGGAPPVPLPGLENASDPAWQPHGPLTVPPSVNLTGLDPDPPLPGDPVRILGSGFDVLIPANNRVFWPTSDGSRELDVDRVAPDALTVDVPVDPAAGQIRVATRNGSAVLDFVPTLGSLEIHAATPWDTPVPGLKVILSDAAGTQVATGETDADGLLVLSALTPARYTMTLTAPSGFAFDGTRTRTLEVGAAVTVFEIDLTPQPDRVVADPSDPVLELGEAMDVTLSVYDVNGNPILQFTRTAWVRSGTKLQVSGSGVQGRIKGVVPSAREGDAGYTVALNNKVFTLGATVTTSITGTVSGTLPEGVEATPGPAGVAAFAAGGIHAAAPGPQGLEIVLKNENGQVLQKTKTAAGGKFRFDGLFQGTYVVQPTIPVDAAATPRSVTVTIDDTNLRGKADFSVAPRSGGRRPGDIVIYKDYNAWFGTNKDELTLQAWPFNFTKDVDYFVRPTVDLKQPIPSTTSIIILTSLSGSGSPLVNVNSPEAQANLDAWVKGGGWLIVHAGDNVSYDGYKVPGLLGIADDILVCTGSTLVPADHPFIRGPDGVLGTEDDATNDNVDNVSGCYDNHGSLEGILPENAEVILIEQGGANRPTYATYTYGTGRVVVSTQTLEWGGNSSVNIRNHFWWTIMGPDATPPPGGVAPAGAPARAPADAPASLRSDLPPSRVDAPESRKEPVVRRH
ncbi:MAG: SdrD B-like domain-containing protein [Gemmatimonadota bacterium]